MKDHFDAGMAAAIRRDDPRHQPEEQRSREPDLQSPGATRADSPRVTARLVSALENRMGGLQESRTGGGEFDAPAGPRQQRRAELVFQVCDLLAERRLRDVQSLGRAREAALLCERNEVAEVTQLHGSTDDPR